MTIAILKLSPGQTIPRPFSRATTIGELAEILVSGRPSKGLARARRAEMLARANDEPAEFITVTAIDTETPVFQWPAEGSALMDKFYAFTEK